MAVTLCPWCQSEIPIEEGQEPDKYCPVCENELDGYRTLTLDIGDEEEEEIGSESFRDDADEEEDEDDSWDDALSLRESGPEGLLLEESVEKILDEQELVPECPNCREYMVEAGEQQVAAGQFKPRVPQSLGKPVLEAPFTLAFYVCPACFTIQTQLAEDGREQMIRGLSAQADASEK